MRIHVLLMVAFVCAAVWAIAQNTETKPAAPVPAAASAVPEGLPDEYGFYHKTDRGWERMHQNRASKTEAKRGGFTQWTGIGVGGIHQKLDYNGPHAQCQIAQPRPAFYARIVDASHLQNLIIVRFRERKDKRQIETAEMVGESTGGGETRSKANVYSVIIKRLSPEVFVLTPEADLPEGEYILSESAYATEGYDFRVGGAPVAN